MIIGHYHPRIRSRRLHHCPCCHHHHYYQCHHSCPWLRKHRQYWKPRFQRYHPHPRERWSIPSSVIPLSYLSHRYILPTTLPRTLPHLTPRNHIGNDPLNPAGASSADVDAAISHDPSSTTPPNTLVPTPLLGVLAEKEVALVSWPADGDSGMPGSGDNIFSSFRSALLSRGRDASST